MAHKLETIQSKMQKLVLEALMSSDEDLRRPRRDDGIAITDWNSWIIPDHLRAVSQNIIKLAREEYPGLPVDDIQKSYIIVTYGESMGGKEEKEVEKAAQLKGLILTIQTTWRAEWYAERSEPEMDFGGVLYMKEGGEALTAKEKASKDSRWYQAAKAALYHRIISDTSEKIDNMIKDVEEKLALHFAEKYPGKRPPPVMILLAGYPPFAATDVGLKALKAGLVVELSKQWYDCLGSVGTYTIGTSKPFNAAVVNQRASSADATFPLGLGFASMLHRQLEILSIGKPQELANLKRELDGLCGLAERVMRERASR